MDLINGISLKDHLALGGLPTEETLSAGPAPGPAVTRVSAGHLHNLDSRSEVPGADPPRAGRAAGAVSTAVLKLVGYGRKPGLTEVTAIDAGDWHSMALLKDGTVRTWGDNQFGELGDGSTTNHLTPTAVPNLTGVTAIAVGGFIASGTGSRRGQDGTVMAWGDNGLRGLLADGTVKAWGFNDVGQLGDGPVGCVSWERDYYCKAKACCQADFALTTAITGCRYRLSFSWIC